MKKGLLILLITLICTAAGNAQELKGIRIDSPRPVVVFINGRQVSTSVQSCFVNGLRRGDYLIEAYAGFQPRGNNRLEKPVFSKRVFYPGDDILLIDIGNDRHPGNFPGRPEFHPREMSPAAFSELQNMLKDAGFDSDKLDILELAAKDNYFTCKQIESVVKTFSFDDDKENAVKILYPSCIDKQNFFTVLKVFTFDSSRKKIMEELNKMY